MFNQSTLNSIQSEARLPALPANIGSFLANAGGIPGGAMSYVFGAAGLILLVMLTISGYQIMFARGDAKATQIAQSRITTSLLGLLILFSAYWIVQIFGQFFGIRVFDQLF